MGQTHTISKHATTVATLDGYTLVIYHQTVVVKASDDTVTLDSGGWHTVTTKTRMNQASNELGLGYRVFQKSYDWYVQLRNGATIPFEDGMTFNRR